MKPSVDDQERAYRLGITFEMLAEMRSEGRLEMFEVEAMRYRKSARRAFGAPRKQHFRKSQAAPNPPVHIPNIERAAKREALRRLVASGQIQVRPRWNGMIRDFLRTESQWREITLEADAIYLQNREHFT